MNTEYMAYTLAGNAVPKNHRAVETLASSHEQPPLEWLVRGRPNYSQDNTGYCWLPWMSSQRG